MIDISKTEVIGFEAAVRGMRNPKNSWALSDSKRNQISVGNGQISMFQFGDADLDLATRLGNAGTDHGKFLRMIAVYADINAPLYWWKEYDTYKVGTVANSCSTMHKITSKEFTLDDFSHEHLNDESRLLLEEVIYLLNKNRLYYFKDNISDTYKKELWWQLIQLLPSSYNQKRTVMLNYAVLKNMYHARKNHKLDEWHDFCHWVEGLPYAKELITNE